MHPSFHNAGGDFISSGPQPGHATRYASFPFAFIPRRPLRRRPSIDENNAASKYFPTLPSASTLHASGPLDTGLTTESDTLARAQTNFSTHSRTPLNEPVPGFPGVDENGRIRATDYATPNASGSVTPERSARAQHVHYPPTVDPAQYYTTVPLDGQEAAGYNMHMDEKNGTAGSGSSAKKRGVLFGGAKRWSQGGQKDVELGGFLRCTSKLWLIIYRQQPERNLRTFDKHRGICFVDADLALRPSSVDQVQTRLPEEGVAARRRESNGKDSTSIRRIRVSSSCDLRKVMSGKVK
jgi:hypothetical protein